MRSSAVALPRRLCLLVASLTVVALVGCTGSPPEILYPDLQLSLVRDPATGDVAEVLRLYVAIRDADGESDPARIFLHHESAGLFWELSSDEWSRVEYAGDIWYGMPDLRMPDGDPLPRGRYTVIAEDQGLSRSTSEAFLTADPPDEPAFPFLIVRSTGLRVQADDEVVLRVYNRSGQMVINQVVVPGAVPSEVFDRIPSETGVQAFVSTLDEGIRLESGPYTIAR
ncbi:MAG: hypothetical protein ACOC1I_04685 [Spirochaetota bacterium]